MKALLLAGSVLVLLSAALIASTSRIVDERSDVAPTLDELSRRACVQALDEMRACYADNMLSSKDQCMLQQIDCDQCTPQRIDCDAARRILYEALTGRRGLPTISPTKPTGR